MGTMAFQITSLTIVYPIDYSGADQRKPAQMASNAENISIWWRHHDSWAYLFGRIVWWLQGMQNYFYGIFPTNLGVNHCDSLYPGLSLIF